MKIPPIDIFSFISGFISALVIVFIVWRILVIRPQLKKAQQERKQKKVVSDTKESELLYRRYLLRKCQTSHLAAGLFPLNNVWVDLKLIGHPFYANPDYSLENEPLVFQQFPISFGNPVLFADLPAPLLSLEEALDGKRNLIIAGDIGSGKTTLMAHFVSKVLEGKCSKEKNNSAFPIFINIRELINDLPEPSELFENISEQLHEINPKINSDSILAAFRNALTCKSLILLLDGFDELPQKPLHQAAKFIGRVIAQYPQIRIIVAAGSFDSGGLEKFGFDKLYIQSPDSSLRFDLIKKWSENINGISNLNISGLPIKLFSSLWLIQDYRARSILDLTLAIWTNFAFDHQPDRSSYLYDYVLRLTSGLITWETLLKISSRITVSDKSSISRKELVGLLESDSTIISLLSEPTRLADGEKSQQSEIRKTVFSNVNEIIDCLLNVNFFEQNNTDRISFANPSVFAYLAANAKVEVSTDWKYLLSTPLDLCILGYSQGNPAYLQQWIMDNSDAYQFRNLLLAEQIIRVNKNGSGYFQNLAKRVYPLVLDESLPATIRLRLSTFFEIDPKSYLSLLDRWKKNPSPIVRQISALGYGNLNNSTVLSSLYEMLSDIDSTVAMASILSLFRIFNKESIELLGEVLLNGKDNLKQFTAELLAFNSIQGHAIIKELSETESIQCKKAAICGLRLIPDKWATELMERISTSDNQWYVRDAAAHALETRWNNSLFIPIQRSIPNEAPWVIKFASQEGYGVPTGIYPYELLYRIIDGGTLEESLAALSYITDKPDKNTVNILVNLMKSDNPLREESFYQYGRIS